MQGRADTVGGGEGGRGDDGGVLHCVNVDLKVVVDDRAGHGCRWSVGGHALDDFTAIAKQEAAVVAEDLDECIGPQRPIFEVGGEFLGELKHLVIAAADGACGEGIGGVDGS